ncbi:hypothetical protein [Paraburkholderia megapolitana]|uniref:hypothetical protein n=1 Tax=Paraburkholderia megapolitana TaxID=420953 RepID=UPI0038BB9DBA
MLNEFRRLIAWLSRAPNEAPAITTAVSHLAFDPVWHGDHWQNLLSSPMDARHYVMEDWSLSLPLDVFTPGVAAQQG